MNQQLLLFDKPLPWRMRPVLWLLSKANGNPPSSVKHLFYLKIKEPILQRYGRFSGHHIQEITRYCWSCDGTGGLYEQGGCYKCGGSGVFARHWVRLQRWQIGNYEFHCPDGSTTLQPGRVDIKGRVNHDTPAGLATECCLWLALLYCPELMDRISIWDLERSRRYPLTRILWHVRRIQKILTSRPNWTRCCDECGKRRWWRKWRYTNICDQCGDDIPF